MFPHIKRFALLSLAIMTTFWVGCSKGGSKDNTPATTQLYQAYKSCKARTGGQSVMYSQCYSQQDAYYNCDCVSDMGAQSIAAYKGQSGQQYYNPYQMGGMNADETIINNYINQYLSQVPADSKRRIMDQWNKIGTQSAGGQYGQQYNQYPYNQQYNQNGYNQWGYQGYCDPWTGMCMY